MHVISALSHAAPLVMLPCDTVFPDVEPKDAGGLWAAMRLRYFLRPPATHGVIDGSIYPLPNKERLIRNNSRRIFYENNVFSKADGSFA